MKFTRTDDTIVAISSPLTGATRGIVRLSGPQSIEILSKALGNPIPEPTKPQRLDTVFPLESSEINPLALLPISLYLWSTGHSYTGEQSAEIHTIGSLPLLNRIVSRLVELGARPAQGGEFTFRAFLSGSLDLTQAEAVLGLIEASDESAFKTAARQLAGGFSSKLKSVREELLNILVYLEAGFDYAEEDISYLTPEQLQDAITSALNKVRDVRTQLQSDVPATISGRVVLIGNPNAGKSSLLNALTGEQAALVSQTPGSTRDYVTKQVIWGGIPLEIVDTAGREDIADIQTNTSIEAQAQKLSNSQKESADIVLLCVPIDEEVPQWAGRFDVLVRTKADGESCELRVASCEKNNGELGCVSPRKELDRKQNTQSIFVAQSCGSTISQLATRNSQLICSAHTGFGISKLKAEIVRLASGRSSSQTEILASTSQRCRELVANAQQYLGSALELCQPNSDFVPEELVAENLRLALNALAEVVGEVYTEDILEGIFGQFCVGK